VAYDAACLYAYDFETCLTVIGDFDRVYYEVVESMVFRLFNELAYYCPTGRTN